MGVEFGDTGAFESGIVVADLDDEVVDVFDVVGQELMSFADGSEGGHRFDGCVGVDVEDCDDGVHGIDFRVVGVKLRWKL